MYYLIFAVELIILFVLSRTVVNRFWKVLSTTKISEQYREYIFALFFLPGTFIHELSHFLTALFLLVPVRQFNLNYQKTGKNMVMGTTPVGKTDPVRSFIISTAPLIFGVLIIVFLPGLVDKYHLIVKIVAGVFIFQVANTMFPSKEDIKQTLGFFVLAGILIAVFYFLGIKVGIAKDGILATDAVDYVKEAVFYLIIPLLLDFLMIFMFNWFIENRNDEK